MHYTIWAIMLLFWISARLWFGHRKSLLSRYQANLISAYSVMEHRKSNLVNQFPDQKVTVVLLINSVYTVSVTILLLLYSVVGITWNALSTSCMYFNIITSSFIFMGDMYIQMRCWLSFSYLQPVEIYNVFYR